MGHLQHLLLEDDDAQGIGQCILKARMHVRDRLTATAPLDVGIDHTSLQRPRPEQSDLDDEIPEGTRLGPLEKMPLARALDLEYADGLGGADEIVDPGVVVRQIVNRQIATMS